MQKLPADFVASLPIEDAVRNEVGTWRNLVPPEPWLETIADDVPAVADWVRARLESGAHNGGVAIISARKGNKGTRPIPVAGIGERIAYRALSDYVLSDVEPPSRKRADYKAFASGPILAAMREAKGSGTGLKALAAYVVETDITAFYEYVDHDALRRELELQTGRIQASSYLVELLGEMQGTTFGLPQLLDASDALSEIYIRIVERDLIRRGLRVWRYNDDFRVLCQTSGEAQDAIEQIAEAARALGLVLNERKTFISRLQKYLWRVFGAVEIDDDLEFDPKDVVATGDYENDDQETADAAAAVLARLDLSEDNKQRINLKQLTGDNLRELRNAIASLGRLNDRSVLGKAVHLFLFAPALSPRLSDYLVDAHAYAPAEVEHVWDTLTDSHAQSLSVWQSAWLMYVARRLGILSDSETRLAYARSQRLRGSGTLLHAEASLALAAVGAIKFAELDAALRTAPECFAPWFVLSIRELDQFKPVDVNQIKAVRDTSPLYRLLLKG